MLFYLKTLALSLWTAICSVLCMGMSLVRWGDLNLDRDTARMVAWLGVPLAGLRVIVEGREHLESRQPCIYVCNHQGSLDVIVLGKVFPSRTILIGKKELLWIPFFGLAFVAAGNILIDRGNRAHAFAGLARAVRRVRESGASVLIFPEGTRNRGSGDMLPFKKGAFHMAIAAGVPVLPIVVSSFKPITGPKGRAIRSGTIRIRVLPPIPSEGREIEDLSRETRERMLEAFGALS